MDCLRPDFLSFLLFYCFFFIILLFLPINASKQKCWQIFEIIGFIHNSFKLVKKNHFSVLPFAKNPIKQ